MTIQYNTIHLKKSGFFTHTSVHHGEWKTSHSNVTCAKTHLLQINLCNKYLKNAWVFHAQKCSSLSHSNVTCATTHLQQIILCNMYFKNIWVLMHQSVHHVECKTCHSNATEPFNIINFITTRCQTSLTKYKK